VGAYLHTPHKAVLDWMRGSLKLWKEAGWGWALWNFHGGFGALDSGRRDVDSEDFKGHKLDRKMLELLRSA
jgi:endoglucanase